MIGNYRIEITQKLMYFPCVQQIYIEPFLFVLKANNISQQNINKTICTWLKILGFFIHHLETIFSLERFWEMYSKAVLRMMNTLFLLTMFNIFENQIGILPWYSTKLSKQRSNHLGQLVRRIKIIVQLGTETLMFTVTEVLIKLSSTIPPWF